MKRLLIPFIAFAAGCLLGASAAFAQSKPRSTYWIQRATLFESLPASEDDIVMLGNSITDGGEWAELLGDAHVKNRGISGDTTDGVLERLGTITRGRPAKVFLLIGINDFSKGVPARRHRREYREDRPEDKSGKSRYSGLRPKHSAPE